MDYTGKRFSVMGDSISTFIGVTKDDPNTFYGRVMCEKGGFAGVQDTWWMRVISALDGTLERVNAYSGSCVADGHGLGRGACTHQRTDALGQPDVILIFMGANDIGFGVSEAEFRASYALMLSRLGEKYPRAEIWCGTIINGRKVLDDEPFFMGENPETPLEPFSSVIRECAAEAGACIADLARADIRYDAIDGCHATARGMEQLADIWITAMKNA